MRRLCFLIMATAIASAAANGPPINLHLVDSPWPTYHQGPARQGSTTLRGPESAEPRVEIEVFPDKFGTSPWHYLGALKADGSRDVWGTSLTHLYKYNLHPTKGLSYGDDTRLAIIPLTTPWNFMALADGRIIVPAPFGLTLFRYLFTPCFTNYPSLLIFGESEEDGKIECLQKFEFTSTRIKEACGFRQTVIGTTAIFSNVMLTGEIAVQILHDEGSWLTGGKVREVWQLVVGKDLTEVLTCQRLTEDSGSVSNGSPMEYGSTNAETVYYVPTQQEVSQFMYDSNTQTITPQGYIPVNFRSGRTGTTPTMLGFGDDEDKFILTVNAKCAVQNVFTGAIECDDSDQSSELVAIPRPLASGATISVPLPDIMETTENSPAVAGNDIVICNYSGYSTDGDKDGELDRATGIVKLSYDPANKQFNIDWINEEIQCSGVPTISTGSNLVYFSGGELDGNTYFYGLRVNDYNNTTDGSVGGDVIVRAFVGPSDTYYDGGSNTIISDDGSAIFPGGNSLIRISDL